MNKKIFTGLVILMGISILGIIIVQLVWINNAIRVKNELFDRSVNEALNNTVNRLEDIHNFNVVNRMVFPDTLKWNSSHDENYDFRFPPPSGSHSSDSLKKAPGPVRIIRNIHPGNKNTSVEIKVDSDDKEKGTTYSYRVETNNNSNSDVIVPDSESILSNNVFFLKTDTIATNIDSLFEVSVVHIDSTITRLDTSKIFQPGFSSRVHTKANRLKRMANQVVNEITTWDVKQINQEQIKEVLEEELKNRNIPIDFKFGVIQDTLFLDKVEPIDSIKLMTSPLQANLYPNDIFQKNIKLSVIFPNRDRFIYRSINWLLVASFMFSLIILLTFTLSIYYILKQKKISEMKSDFINNMTHEFKTPIATISVATDSITNEKVVNDPERIKYFAGMIKKENTRMNRQVEDILTIARLDKKDFEFNWEAINIHELIDDAIQGIEIQVEKRNGTIEKKLQAVNAVVTTDKVHFTNVVFNLLDNAIKYSVDAPKIEIATKNKSGGVMVSITDNGIGMSKVVQSKIFERFYRQSHGNIHNVKGFGLGLSYVKAVIEANHGTISVHSEPGKGSKFDVSLPFVRE